MILEILKDGDEILRKESCPVILTDEVRKLIEDMKETMIHADGMGLSAPQVGKNIRVIVVKLLDNKTQEMINPVIKWHSINTCNLQEGCLSIPGMYFDLTRPIKISVKFQDLSGKYKKWKLKSWESRVVQHEIDHLNGVLMTDY
tara:strand:- start:286 stop:717 length:432 start_codon:yes stop_codon:yes gene_type:complete